MPRAGDTPSEDELVERVAETVSPEEEDSARLEPERGSTSGEEEIDAPPRQLDELRCSLDQIVVLAARVGLACADASMRQLCLRTANHCRAASTRLQREQLFLPRG